MIFFFRLEAYFSLFNGFSQEYKEMESLQIFSTRVYFSGYFLIFLLVSNRLLALLVLFWVFSLLFLIYIYFFVFYTSTIIIKSNVEEYQVKLFAKSTARSISYDCPEKLCELSDISPVEYNLTIVKDGYEDFFQNIDISPSSKQELIITLEKKVTLEKTQWEDIVSPEQSGDINAQDKIAQIRLEKNYDTLFNLDSGNKIGIKDKQTRIELYYISENIERLIDTFDKNSSVISVKEVEWLSYIYIAINGKKYLYNTEFFQIEEIKLVPNIVYIKEGKNPTELLFITEKGAFVYDRSEKSFSYFYIFQDFVYHGNGYIWVIYKDETQKLSNYNLTEETQNLIIRYTPDTQEREILYRTDLKIDKIFKEEGEIFIISGWEKFKLNNY